MPHSPGETPAPAKRILIVEDNALLAYDLQDLIEEAGYRAIGPALTLDQGQQLVRADAIDAALLDIELGAERVWPLAEHLQRIETPFAFISAQCSSRQMPDAYKRHTCISKPAESSQILATLRTLVTR